ncbi:hypothetical protein E2542_SST18617 [Spatholobus suberectus]|nr:hypothetical protein E2542_SST18617 [Spatholobus suberectus]
MQRLVPLLENKKPSPPMSINDTGEHQPVGVICGVPGSERDGERKRQAFRWLPIFAVAARFRCDGAHRSFNSKLQYLVEEFCFLRESVASPSSPSKSGFEVFKEGFAIVGVGRF